MSQSDPSSATPIDWSDGSTASGAPAWQGPPAHRPAPTPEPMSTDPAFPDTPWVQEGTAHTAQEVHQAWTDHQSSPEALSGGDPVPTPWQTEALTAAPEPALPVQERAVPEPAVQEPATAAAPTVDPTTDESTPAPEDDTLSLGRARSNSIVLDDMLVSRHHARISADDHGLIIEDLGSRNGTFVNGRRVQTTRLHEGDRIGIGASTFEVRDGWLVSG